MINSINYVSDEEIEIWISKTKDPHSTLANEKAYSFNKHAPKKIKQCLPFFKQAIEENPYLYLYASEEIKKNREITFLAVSNCSGLFYCIDKSFISDNEFVLKLINKNEDFFIFSEHRFNLNFKFNAIKVNAKVLTLIDNKDLNDNFLIQAFSVNAESIFYINPNNKQIAFEFVESLKLDKIKIVLKQADEIIDDILSEFHQKLKLANIRLESATRSRDPFADLESIKKNINEIANEKREKIDYFNELKKQLFELEKILMIRQNYYRIDGNVRFNHKKLGCYDQ